MDAVESKWYRMDVIIELHRAMGINCLQILT